MNYDQFAEKFLKAIYLETEETGQPYHRAGEILRKYGLTPKPHWIARLADAWEFIYFKEVSKVLGGYDGWSFRISAEGSRRVEDEIEAEETVSTVFDVPAADRIVQLSHNQVQQADQEVTSLIESLESDNGNPDQPGLRERLIGQIKAGRELIRSGQYRAYLLYEVLVKALSELISKYGNPTIAALANALLGAFVAKLLDSN